MDASLKRLLGGIIDYAGLFPPAKLPLEESIDNYLRYRDGKQQWIMNRFICPASKLDKLGPLLEEHDVAEEVPVSVVATAAGNWHEWETAMEKDAKAMTAFEREWDELAVIESIELKMPQHDGLEQFLPSLNAFDEIETYVELPWATQMSESLAIIAETDWLCAKGRTGGVEPAAFPSTADVAAFLQQCSHLDLRFKLTAGLHHPFRHTDKNVGAKAHGFFNVLFALAIDHAQDLSVGEFQEILEDENPASFTVKPDHLIWRENKASLEDIDAARNVFVGYGSCSIDEPLEDLTNLGLLPGVKTV